MAKLAIDGGEPAKKNPPPPMFPGATLMDEQEERAVVEVVRSRRLYRHYGMNDTPSRVEAFEEQFARRMATAHARAVSSGTAALICALVGAGVGPGDEVIVPGYTWIATALAVVAVGAIPVIAEVDDSLGLDAEDVEKKLTPLTKAIIAVHMRGVPVDLDPLCALARQRGIVVIEDVAQACGGAYRGRPLGSIGDIGAFSLQFNKILTTGEGGVVITNDPARFARVSVFHDTISEGMGRKPRPGLPALPVLPGQNYRASEFIGALGVVQLGRLDTLLAAMRDRQRRIREGASGIRGIRWRRVPDEAGDAGTSLTMFVEPSKAIEFAMALTSENVRALVLYIPRIADLHVYAHWTPILQKASSTPAGFPWAAPFYKGNVEYSKDMCPRTLELCSSAVSIDVSPLLSDEDVEQTVLAIEKVAAAVL